jgi:hypothetical protein
VKNRQPVMIKTLNKWGDKRQTEHWPCNGQCAVKNIEAKIQGEEGRPNQCLWLLLTSYSGWSYSALKCNVQWEFICPIRGAAFLGRHYCVLFCPSTQRHYHYKNVTPSRIPGFSTEKSAAMLRIHTLSWSSNGPLFPLSNRVASFLSPIGLGSQ